MRTKVSEKGQITIPKPLRDQLGIRVGMELEFTTEKGRLVGAKIEPEDPILSVTGIVDAPLDVDDYLDRTRGPGV
ncbi:MAG TPA: AbrB/MazE/SpoVT family DNA-binding domain-containing protein [Candidatus Latescibacteria bacterium]|jgi:AbrB family looped-hinge helix DNA binding protein|nr:AbrB/MazE/SpoVT family DNA-binding domain-containing protein [Gemmatimonadaceae bacterium]MDP6015161.1 AbrB/MazE/SpoVT family DNA-binding domain-containing protein [Candidatus Latescibacterota bacterium]HJP33045.1 AbrB/MazE/SpoVT family DNA-binding domain-containing protein [Candidatus Latescibacterota bacterium]|tara:strand:+ start:416 stop:640 length:225 start_codon:yes stop_codon:yes gene_type:complete